MHSENLGAVRLRPDKRTQRKVLTRQELLLAGRRLFSEQGLYESRVEDLTRTAGIAKGTLYLYFRDKEALIQAVVTAGFALLEQRVRERTASARTLSDVVGRIVAVHMEFFVENPDLMRIFHQARGMLKFDRPRWRRLRIPLLRHLKITAEILGHVPTLARLSSRNRRDLAIQLFGVVSGVSSVRLTADPDARVDVDTKDLSRALVVTFRQRSTSNSTTGSQRRTRRVRAIPRRRVSRAILT